MHSVIHSNKNAPTIPVLGITAPFSDTPTWESNWCSHAINGVVTEKFLYDELTKRYYVLSPKAKFREKLEIYSDFK